MKKIQLSIPEPCHENWNEMKPEDRGRFCGSCQKTVIDFTTMSDRQLAAFFKQPAGSVCGRFHGDQLDRAIEISKKRIPWVKYFFTVTWPAFVLLLKGCGQRDDVVGELAVQVPVEKKDNRFPVTMLGAPLLAMKPVDSVPITTKSALPVKPEAPPVTGKLKAETLIGDTTIVSLPQIAVDTIIKEAPPMNPVNITGYGTCSQNIRMGGLVATRVDVVKQEAIPLTETPKQTIDATAYPNPVKAGNQLTITSDDGGRKQVQLFSSSGTLIKFRQAASFKAKNFTLTIPPSVAAGTYFVRIVSENKQPSTVKIIVLN